ncbi:MAG TPA: DNA-3-methyladenine glycosylase [Puia sp.]|jgi:DNA-3-methyladenine glycosylase|nr:DNA-3-methyladenine glycosylase [Puia sp.]
MTENRRKLKRSFYDRDDVVKIARELLGKILVTKVNGVRSSGRIVETEAYAGFKDRASHAFGGRRTTRSEHLYGAPGTIYVYICYGMYHLFNVITNKKDIPHGVLIRALEPLEGLEHMQKRTDKFSEDYTITKGPGNLSRAMGMSKLHSGCDILSEEIFIEDDGLRYKKNQIVVTKRIGVDGAGKDAELPYRFIVRDNPYVSAKKS